MTAEIRNRCLKIQTPYRDRRRRHRRPVRRQRADRARPQRLGLRAGPGARRDRRRRLPHAEQRAPSGARRPRPRGGEMGRARRPEVALLPPRRRADRAGAGHRRVRLERHLRHAPRRPRRFPRRALPPRHRHTAATAPRASSRAATSPASASPTAPPSRPTWSSPPTASTPSFGPYVFPPSKPVFHGTISYRGLVPRERLPDWPMDRWQMWAGPSKHFLVFPVRHGTMVNYVGFVPADAEMKESWSAPGDPDVLRAEFEGWDPRIGAVLQQVDTLLPLGAVRPRAAADLDQGPADAARRRRASDAAASRPGREPVDRGRHGAGDDPVAGRQRAQCPRRCWPTSGCAASASPRCSSARGRTGCGVDSAYADLAVRDAELARARGFPQASLCV